MHISRTNKFLFIRVPKTGSTTAHAALNNAFTHYVKQGPDTHHETYREIIDTYQNIEEQLEDFRIIAFVREPVAWINSLFSLFRAQEPWALKWMDKRVRDLDKPIPAAFIEAIPTPYDWMTDKHGVCKVNEIWRMEDLTKFCADLDLPPLWENRTSNQERRQLAFTGDDLAAIQRKFHRELKHYPGWPDWKRE